MQHALPDVSFFSILGHGWLLCHDTLLFQFSLHGSCEGPKTILFFSLTWVSHMERHYKQTFVFLSLQGGCEGPNRVLFFTLASVGDMYRVLKVNFFCFGLV